MCSNIYGKRGLLYFSVTPYTNASVEKNQNNYYRTKIAKFCT